MSESNSNKGLGFFGVLTIVFIVLKLCHLIDWPWLWVLTPIWIGLGLLALELLVIMVLVIAAIMVSKR